MTWVYLTDADLTDADLNSATVHIGHMGGAKLMRTNLADVDLAEVGGLTTEQLRCAIVSPSTVLPSGGPVFSPSADGPVEGGVSPSPVTPTTRR